jgi:hypothetical protein
MSHPQEIFNPVIARLRAFSWPAKPKKKKHASRDVEKMTDGELLTILSRGLPRDKEGIFLYKSAQGELQRRYLKQLAASIPEWGAWGGRSVTFDTETQNIETGQAMRFGVAQIRGYGYRELIDFMTREGRPPSRSELDDLREVIIFYDPQMIEMDQSNAAASLAILEAMRERRESASGVPHYLIVRDDFVETILFRSERIKDDIPLPILVIGHKLDFDVERLPVYPPTKARGEFVYGGFSLIMGRTVTQKGKRKGEPNGPRVIIKKIGPGKNTYRAVHSFNARLHTHYFVDTLMSAKALLGADAPGGMDALCKMFGAPIPKETVEHFKPLTNAYAEYCYNDVDRTWFIYTKLRDVFHEHGRSKLIWRTYSVASVGKGYYEDFGVEKYLEKNIRGASDPHSLKSLKLCGVSMEAMLGARAECGVRHQIREGINKDFKSQYPTINIKLDLQRLLLAERVDIEEDERTASGEWLRGGRDAAFLEAISILDFDDCPAGVEGASYLFGAQSLLSKNRSASNALWRELIGFAQIDPAGCILPLRTTFQDDASEEDGKASTNVGLSEIEHGPPIWASYLEILASKFLTGRMPRMLRTMRMIPIGRQSNLGKINFFGDPDYVIDLSLPETNIFRSILEMRDVIKDRMKGHDIGSPEFNRLNAMQNALKLIAKAHSSSWR